MVQRISKSNSVDLTAEERRLLKDPKQIIAIERLMKVRKLRLELRQKKGELREATEVRNKMVVMYQVGRASIDSLPARFAAEFGKPFTGKMRRFLKEQMILMLEDMASAGGE